MAIQLTFDDGLSLYECLEEAACISWNTKDSAVTFDRDGRRFMIRGTWEAFGEADGTYRSLDTNKSMTLRTAAKWYGTLSRGSGQWTTDTGMVISMEKSEL